MLMATVCQVFDDNIIGAPQLRLGLSPAKHVLSVSEGTQRPQRNKINFRTWRLGARNIRIRQQFAALTQIRNQGDNAGLPRGLTGCR
jgi:hypothetical protein